MAAKTLLTILKEILSISMNISTSSEQGFWTIAFLKGFVNKCEQNTKFFSSTERFAGFLKEKSWSYSLNWKQKIHFLWE